MIEKIFSLFQNKSVQNSIWIVIERIITAGISAVVTILSARHLGAENFGTLSYGLTFVTLFAGIMKLGLDAIMVDELMKSKSAAGSLLGTSIVLRLISSVVSVFLILVILSVVNAGQTLVITVALIQSAILVFQAVHVLDFWFQSRLESKYVSIAKIVGSSVMGLYSTYLLVSGKNVLWFAASTSLSALILGIILIIFYLKKSDSRLSYSFSQAKYLLSKSYHFILVSIISTIYTQIDRIMIGNMIDQTAVGLYSAALTLCLAWIFLPQALTISLRPTIIAAKKISYDLYLRRLKLLYFIIFWLSFMVCGIIALSAPVIIPLFFGEEFSESILVTQLIVWHIPLSVLGSARSIWTVAEEKYKYPKYYLIHGLILNVGLNIILIPQYGIIGAAISTLVTEAWTCFISPIFFKETRVHTKILMQALRYKMHNKERGKDESSS